MSKSFVSIIATILTAVALQAQNLPELSADGAVKQGTLADGIKFCLVPNASPKGVAEFSLLQRVCQNGETDERISFARDLLSRNPRFGARSIPGLAGSNGACFGPGGIITADSDNILFRFREVETARGDAVTDSLLLAIFDIIDQSIAKDPKVYGTTNQVILIAGDIDVAAVQKKLATFSLMIPKSNAPIKQTAYEWKPSSALVCTADGDGASGPARISISYKSPRPDAKRIGSVITTISDRMDRILAKVLEDRVSVRFRSLNIPVADMETEILGSREHKYDRSFTFRMSVNRDNAAKSVAALSSILSGLDAGGVDKTEFSCAAAAVDREMALEGAMPQGNSAIMDKCLFAILYGTDTSTPATRAAFFSGKVIDPAIQTKHFNGYISSLLDSSANAYLHCSSSGVDATELKKAFLQAWDSPDKDFKPVNMADTLAFAKPSAGKIKPTSTSTDAMTGGTLWTFSNGMRVLYRKMATGGLCYYSLGLRSGAATVQDITKGETAFYSTLLSKNSIGPINAADFKKIMASQGISMDFSVSLSDIVLSGEVPSNRLPSLLKDIVAFSIRRKTDGKSYDYDLACEAISCETESIQTIAEAKLHPDFNYSLQKRVEGLDKNMGVRAEVLFDSAFSRLNNGILVLAGDREPDYVLEQVTQYILQFPCAPGTTSQKKPISFKTVSGSSMSELESGRKHASVFSSVPTNRTADNVASASVAEVALKDALDKAFVHQSFWCSNVSFAFRTHPQEQICLRIDIEPLCPESLAKGAAEPDMNAAINLTGKVLESLATADIPEAELKIYRTLAQNALAVEQTDPAYWLKSARNFYLESKDLTTDLAKKQGAVPAAAIKALFSAIHSGARAEIIEN